MGGSDPYRFVVIDEQTGARLMRVHDRQSIIGTRRPVPGDKFGREMIITGFADGGVIRLQGFAGETFDEPIVICSGRLLKKDGTKSHQHGAQVPLSELTSSDCRWLADQYRQRETAARLAAMTIEELLP